MEGHPRSNKNLLAYAAASAAILLYVALCTGFRDNHWGADAWEHHRAIQAMVADFWSPGNPTLAVDATSIRYSPYIALLALVSIGTKLDPYHVLSGAAVVNTALLLFSLRRFLRVFGCERDAICVLPFLLLFYGSPPAYSNSLALTDLPWHQVNPSACCLGLTLIAWTLFQRARGWLDWRVFTVGALTGCILVSHAMTGLFLLLGLVLLTLATREVGARKLLHGLVIAGLALGLALLWPWYSFSSALGAGPNNQFFFDRDAIRLMLTQWCLPGLLVFPVTFALRREPLVRLAWIGTAVTYGGGLLSFALQWATPGRLPLTGLIYAHIGLGLFASRSGLFTRAGLADLFRRLCASGLRTPRAAWWSLAVLGVLLGSAGWQGLHVAWQPHLARAYIAPLFGKPSRQLPLHAILDELLDRVGTRDVVLADVLTAWPIPSSKGRVVAALHLEYFVEGQEQRLLDVERFFGEASDAERRTILGKYGVRWIVLRGDVDEGKQLTLLLEESAVVARQRDLVLMDASAWLAARP